MDKLDSMIADIRRRREAIDRQMDELAAQRERLTLQLDALLTAAELRPVTHARAVPLRSEDGRRTSGRQPGSITGKWKEILVRWHMQSPDKGLDYLTIQRIAEQVGINSKMHSIRDRIRKYRDVLELIEKTDGGHRVKPETYNRFRDDVTSAAPGVLSLDYDDVAKVATPP